MLRVEMTKWSQSLEDLRRASIEAPHARTRERFQALYLIASGQFNATTCAAHIGRQDETVLAWIHRYNKHGPNALSYRHTGGTPPLFTQEQIHQIVEQVEKTDPSKEGLFGHNWTVKKLKQWVSNVYGRDVSRNTLRRVLRQAGLTWKKIKKLLGKGKPEKRAAHVELLQKLFASVCDGEIILLYVDEAHFHRDLDLGYTWGRIGKRIWRKSDCPKLSERLDCYGAYDFSNGECFLWEEGWCNGTLTVKFLQALVNWRAGKKGKLVVIWDNAPCHIAKVAKAEAARLGIELVYLPGYSPDLNPIERLWDWLREEVTRGHCHSSVGELTKACQVFIERINRDPIAVLDRLWPKFELDPEFEEKLRVSA
jgi:transposase